MKKRAGIYTVVAVLMASGWYALAYRPTVRHKAALEGKIAEAQSQLDDFDATIMSLPSHLETERNLLQSKQGLQSKLYGKDEILELFRRLKEDARTHQLEITEISPPVSELLKLNELARDKNELQFLNLTLDITGTYIDFGRFADDLEHMAFFRGVNYCRITPQSEQPGYVDITLGVRALLTGPGRNG
jgi:Tfp pilus assembly protein PilO